MKTILLSQKKRIHWFVWDELVEVDQVDNYIMRELIRPILNKGLFVAELNIDVIFTDDLQALWEMNHGYRELNYGRDHPNMNAARLGHVEEAHIALVDAKVIQNKSPSINFLPKPYLRPKKG